MNESRPELLLAVLRERFGPDAELHDQGVPIMSEYRVNIPKVIWLATTVEAENEQEAIDKAIDGAPSLCAQCVGWGREWGVEEDEWGGIEDVAPQFAVTAELVQR